MTDKPILFSGPMVRALLREAYQPGTGKTQTRRVMPNQDLLQQAYAPIVSGSRIYNYSGEEELSRARFSPGDRLWCREAWRISSSQDDIRPRDLPAGLTVEYLADGRWKAVAGKGRPSMFMPRWASRLTLIVTGVKIERLQDISEEDAIAEGCAWSDCHEGFTPCPEPGDGRFYHGRWAARSFQSLWESINGDDAWEANPWVAAYTFTVHRANIDALGKDAA